LVCPSTGVSQKWCKLIVVVLQGHSRMLLESRWITDDSYKTSGANS
jgi:hypothetical protein